MTRECLHYHHTSYVERYTSYYRTSITMKVTMALGNARISCRFTERPTQLYSVSMAALWTYDYLLTVGDEVGIYQ